MKLALFYIVILSEKITAIKSTLYIYNSIDNNLVHHGDLTNKPN